MIDAYPDTLAQMSIHDGDALEIPWGTTRDAYYGASWTPCNVNDGLEDTFPPSTYESKFLTRQAIPTDVTIEVSVFGAGESRQVWADVCIEPTGTGKTMNVWMAQLLDHYGPVNFDRNMVRGGSGSTEITLTPGECTTVIEDIALDAESQAAPENIKFFVWAQDTNKVWNPDFMIYQGTHYEAYSSEVYQAGKALAPFEGVFIDGFESANFSGWSTISP